LQIFGYLFLVLLPLSIWLWSMVLVGSGFVRSIPEMPWEFRLAARVTGPGRGDASSPLAVPVTLCCLALVNLSAPLILVGPFGPLSSVGAVAYLVAQLLWLARIRRAVRRAERH
jgi:hypothetical protein